MANGIHFVDSSFSNFQKALERVGNETTRSAASTVQYGAIRFAMSGRANTKVGKKNREVIRNTENKSKWLIVVKHQNRPDTFIPTNSRTSQRRVIKMRGAAKNSWNGVFRKLNGRSFKTAGGGRGASWGTAKKVGMKTPKPTIFIENFTSYIMKAFPALVPTAFNKAANAMQAMLDRKVAKKMENSFK